MSNEFDAENVSLGDWKKYFKIQLFKEIDSTHSELVRRGNAMSPLLNEDGSLTENGGVFNNTLVAAMCITSSTEVKPANEPTEIKPAIQFW